MLKLTFLIANMIFLIHICFGVYVLIGWLWPEYYEWYYLALGSWISTWLILGYCPLSRLEFSIRRTYDPTINPRREIIQHYIHKFTGAFVPSRVIFSIGLAVFFVLVLLTTLQSQT